MYPDNDGYGYDHGGGDDDGDDYDNAPMSVYHLEQANHINAHAKQQKQSRCVGMACGYRGNA